MALSSSSTITRERNWGVVEPVTLPNNKQQAFRLFMKSDGVFHNNLRYPTILVKNAVTNKSQDECEQMIVRGNSWTSPWVWGIFPFHHYHSTAWELLVCVRGAADVQLGGQEGPVVAVEKNDLVLIPPGVAHKQLSSSGGFTLLGSYPMRGCSGSVDTLRESPTKQQVDNIEACIAPATEPILGLNLEVFF